MGEFCNSKGGSRGITSKGKNSTGDSIHAYSKWLKTAMKRLKISPKREKMASSSTTDRAPQLLSLQPIAAGCERCLNHGSRKANSLLLQTCKHDSRFAMLWHECEPVRSVFYALYRLRYKKRDFIDLKYAGGT